jgi:hypothetical protein
MVQTPWSMKIDFGLFALASGHYELPRFHFNVNSSLCILHLASSRGFSHILYFSSPKGNY